MTDKFIGELDNVTTFNDADLLVKETDPSGTPETNNLTIGDFIANYLKRNTYQITRIVASNNFTVSIKDSDGNDATAAKPLNFNINGSIRKLTGALSITVNAGANVFNLGATEFANLAQELFVYLGWRASDSSVFLLLSRIPYAKEYADFHITNTNERYGAFTGSSPAGTDSVTVIGRVNIQNSGTASYNWSIPLVSTIVNRPIYQTTWLDWTPTLAGFSGGNNPTGTVNRYKLDYNTVSFFIRQLNNGTSNATTFTISLPFTAKTITNMVWSMTCSVVDNGTGPLATPGIIRVLSAATVADVFKDSSNAAFTNINGKRLGNMGVLQYEIGV